MAESKSQDHTASDAFLLIAFVAGISGGLFYWFAPTTSETIESLPLADRLNPNLASMGQLTLLPGIGPVRAEAIIAYRCTQRKSSPFSNSQDLTVVPGIGMKTAQRLDPWLTFSQDAE